MAVSKALFTILLILASSSEATAEIRVSLLSDSHDKQFFEVSGLKAKSADDAKTLFFVQVVDDKNPNADTPAMLGTYKTEESGARFFPRFPLDPKLKYRVCFRNDVQLPDERRTFSITQPNHSPSAEVVAVYPSASTLPENLLKFYIHFSEPMNRGEAYRHIKLYRGKELVKRPFLELGEELWDRGQMRFTLFIHPGLIKRGVKPREDQGPPIERGSQYTLVIGQDWSTPTGHSLIKTFEKEFHVSPADHSQPSLEKWKIETPRSASRSPVQLTFNESLDHAMLLRVFQVKNQDDEVIEGNIELSNNETTWKFSPSEPWEIGTYNIEVAANLEDLAGNSIARPFEVKMQERAVANPTTKVAIEFIVR